jgi:hypothetical protein
MKGRAALNLALLAAVIALALFAYYKPHKGEPEHKLSAIKATDATSIRIEIAGSPPIALARTGTDWNLTAPLPARADSLQVQRLLEILDATARDRFPASGLARYDLNEPPARLTINQQTFGFGAVNEMSREQYVLTQDGIYPVSLRYGTLLPRTVYQLVSRQLFGADEAARWQMAIDAAGRGFERRRRHALGRRMAPCRRTGRVAGQQPQTVDGRQGDAQDRRRNLGCRIAARAAARARAQRPPVRIPV